MLYGKLPYEPMKSVEMYQQIIKKNIFPNDGKINGFRPSPEVLSLLKRLLVVDHRQRIDWKELIKLEIFQDQDSICQSYRITVSLSDLKFQ